MNDRDKSREDLLAEIATLREQLRIANRHPYLRHLFDHTQYMVAVFDHTGTLVIANKAASRLLERPQDVLVGMHLRDLLPERYDELQELIGQVVRTGDIRSFEDHPTDKARWLLSMLEPIPVPGEPTPYVKLTTFDFTERTIKHERDLFEHLFKNSPIGILVFDHEGNLVNLNQHIERLVDAPAEEIMGWRFDDPRWYLKDEDGLRIPLEELPFSRVKRSGEPLANEVYIMGDLRSAHKHLLVSASPMRTASGSFDGVILSIANITDLVHMRRELQSMQERLGFHMQNSPLAVIEWDADLRVTTYSGRAEGIFGWAAEEVLGLRWDEWNYVHPGDVEHIDTLNEELLATDKPDHFIIINRNLRKDGRVIWCQWYVSLRRTANGSVDSILTFVADITTRVERERELRLHEAMLAQAQEIARMSSFSWDLETNTITWSQDLREFYDLEAHASPYALFPHIHPPDRPAIRAFIARVLEGDEEDMTLTFRFVREGHIHHVRARCQHVTGLRDKPRVVGYVQDITRTVETERELRRHREHLSELVEARTRELREANDRLQRMSRLKDEFVSNVSHELRTPITSLKVRLHTLARKPDALSDYLPVLQRETNRLQQTIENLLLLSHLDQTAIEVAFEAIELVPFLEQYVADRQLVAAKGNLTLRMEESDVAPTVRADPNLLERLLSILVSNALQYTPPGGEVTVSTETRQQGRQQWVGFAVRDDGPGIPTEEQETVFERFIRGRGAYESGQPGTGLGLAIAREIVTTHGGFIELESSTAEPSGTTFFVWLPV